MWRQRFDNVLPMLSHWIVFLMHVIEEREINNKVLYKKALRAKLLHQQTALSKSACFTCIYDSKWIIAEVWWLADWWFEYILMCFISFILFLLVFTQANVVKWNAVITHIFSVPDSPDGEGGQSLRRGSSHKRRQQQQGQGPESHRMDTVTEVFYYKPNYSLYPICNLLSRWLDILA